MADNEANESRVDQSIKLQSEMSGKIIDLFDDYIQQGMTFAEAVGVIHISIQSIHFAKHAQHLERMNDK